jgi:hypothetical protein
VQQQKENLSGLWYLHGPLQVPVSLLEDRGLEFHLNFMIIFIDDVNCYDQIMSKLLTFCAFVSQFLSLKLLEMAFFPSPQVMDSNPARREAGCGSRHTSKLFHDWSLHIFLSPVSFCFFQVFSFSITYPYQTFTWVYICNYVTAMGGILTCQAFDIFEVSIYVKFVFSSSLLVNMLYMFFTGLKTEWQSAIVHLESARADLSKVANELQAASSESESASGKDSAIFCISSTFELTFAFSKEFDFSPVLFCEASSAG